MVPLIIIEVANYVYNNFENKYSCTEVYRFAKFFDSVNHSFLLQKRN